VLRVSCPPLQLDTPLIDEVAICSDFAVFGQPESCGKKIKLFTITTIVRIVSFQYEIAFYDHCLQRPIWNE